jgi:hypothetical protein
MSSLVRVTLGTPAYNRDPYLADVSRSGLWQDFPLADLLAAVPAASPVGLL